MKITFIGGGNMGEAMLSALVSKHVASAKDITVSEPIKTVFNSSPGNTRSRQPPATLGRLAGADVVVLAVKPQVLPLVLTDLAGLVKGGQLVLSIMAGHRIETLRNGLNHKAIVRSMPNTPAQIGEGVTVWTATPEEVSTAQRSWLAKS